MMSDNSVLLPFPITDEQARFGQEMAILGQEVVKAFCGLGGFVEKALGSAPQDLVGLLGGDWLRFRRIKNIAQLLRRSKEILEDRGIREPQQTSLSVVLPIIRSSADESRTETQELWARLLAAALDPAKSLHVRQVFSEIISKLEPLDALLLVNVEKFDEVLSATRATKDRETRRRDFEALLVELDVSEDQYEISVNNLLALHLSDLSPKLQPLGREFLRVVVSP